MKTRKNLAAIFAVALVVSLSLPAFAASSNYNSPVLVETICGDLIPIGEGKFISVNPVVTPDNYGDVSALSDPAEPNLQQTYTVDSIETHVYSDGVYETSCVVTAGVQDLSKPTPRDSQTSERTESAITVTLTLKYSLRNNYQEIKITNVSGGWSSAMPHVGIDARNQVVTVLDGQAYSEVVTYEPTGSSFSYDIPWDYVLLYPQTDYSGPRAYYDLEYNITGMGYMWVPFTLWLHLDFGTT